MSIMKAHVLRAYSIFDDYTREAVEILENAGISVTVHPNGVPRPDHDQMKRIMEEYEIVIIGTSQKISEDMFEAIGSPRIIATASVGMDHIRIPLDRSEQTYIVNTPKANAQSVAEYTIGCALSCCKRLEEGKALYSEGRNNKELFSKPEDLSGKTMGVVGAGNISVRIMDYAQMLGMKVICWTRNPGHHSELTDRGVVFTDLDDLLREADYISVNLPNNAGTKNLISADRVALMKNTAVFISVSRADTIDAEALLRRAKADQGFYVCLDLDVDERIVSDLRNIYDGCNVLVTPHIAAGTVETRKRMFLETAKRIAELVTGCAIQR